MARDAYSMGSRMSFAGNRHSWSPLWSLLKGYQGRVAALALVSFVGAMFEAGILVILTSTVLAITEGRDTVSLSRFELSTLGALAGVAGMLVVRLVLSLVGVRLSAGLSRRVLTDLRFRLSRVYLNASWEVQQAEPAGRLQELLTTFVNQAAHSVKAFTNWVTALLSLAAFLTAAVVVDATATGLVVVALGVLGTVLYPLRRLIRKRAARDAHTGLAFTNSVSELGSLGLEMQAHGVQGEFANRIRALSRDNAQARYGVQVLSEALAPVYMALAYGAVVGGVTLLAVLGTSNLASVGAVLLLMLRSLSYGQSLQSHSGSIAAALPYVTRMREALATYEAAAASGGDLQPAAATPLELDAVRFAYSPERDALNDVSLRIETNEIVGVIGPSGAGKSTLVQLLLGLRDPSDGVIRAGGTDLREIDRDWWTRRVALVAQDALLFTGTVAENIRFFREGIDEAGLRRAAAQANLLEDIEALPQGFDTHLGERGTQLSGGQRQRLSIARALAGEPELLILDEPTSALDVRSEGLIRDTLTGLRGRTTVVIIAHRMSTLDISDRILVIEGGRATGFGVPKQLYQTNEFYRNALAMSGIAPQESRASFDNLQPQSSPSYSAGPASFSPAQFDQTLGHSQAALQTAGHADDRQHPWPEAEAKKP